MNRFEYHLFYGVEYKSVAYTDVLWAGWECDSLAWVTKKEGENVLITTDHGCRKITDKSFLENKIKEYEEAIEKSKIMLELLN